MLLVTYMFSHWDFFNISISATCIFGLSCFNDHDMLDTASNKDYVEITEYFIENKSSGLIIIICLKRS